MHLRVLETDLALAGCSARFPFRYGVVTLREGSQLTARVTIEADGRRVTGWAADLLVPKWFEKDPRKSLGEDALALTESARLAAEAWADPAAPATSFFEHWWRVYRERVLAVPTGSPDRLTRGFGVALIERAALDALCRLAGVTFHRALRDDLLGLRPGRVDPLLEGWRAADELPEDPLAEVRVRHTVGLLDPLRADQVPAELAVDDGLPVALEEDVDRYGLELFKVKVAGDDRAASERLRSVAAVVRERAGDAARFTLDGNEQVEDLGAFLALLEEVRSDADGAWLLERLLWIEQPLHRAVSFDPARCAPLGALSEVAPVILDEADGGIECFPRAVELGYRGVSVKNCKGVLRALLNRAYCARLGEGLFQSAEDLTNLPVLALQQDLATVASLGLEHAERNGHHYFRGLEHLPPVERAAALDAHPRLYREEAGEVRLALADGRLDVRDVVGAVGYGHATTPDLDARTPLEEWEAEVTR